MGVALPDVQGLGGLQDRVDEILGRENSAYDQFGHARSKSEVTDTFKRTLLLSRWIRAAAIVLVVLVVGLDHLVAMASRLHTTRLQATLQVHDAILQIGDLLL